MEEYVVKDLIKKRLKIGRPAVGTHDAEIYRSGYDYCESVIQCIPTITKADIRAEVIDECIKEISTMECRDDYGLVYPHTVCNVLEMLKERE